MLPPNMTLWCKDSFELKANEKKQVQEKLSALRLFKSRIQTCTGVPPRSSFHKGQKLLPRDSSGPLGVYEMAAEEATQQTSLDLFFFFFSFF